MEEQQQQQQQIPNSPEAEKSVLGSILLSNDAAEKALELLKADDFYSVAHRDIFSAMQKLYSAGKVIDAVTLVDMLEKLGKLDSAGGTTYITELALYTPSPANITHYINIVEGHSIRRRLMFVGTNIAKEAGDMSNDTAKVLEDAERQIYDIAMRRASDSVEPISEVYPRVYARIGELMQLKGKKTGIPTGLIDLDELTSGLQRSDLVIVAARPAMGKTAFALNIASYAAVHEKAVCALFNFEMSKEQLVMRIMASEAGVNMQKLRTGVLEPEEILRIADRFNTVGEAGIFLDDTPNATVTEIRSKCRRIKAMHGLDMVVIDYLQLMDANVGKDSSRVQEISAMTRQLKALARELDIVVLVLSQLSREPDKRKDHMPLMSDLRESGSIEQDADIVMMLYRPSVYPDNDEYANGDNTTYVNLVKHRNGPTGNVRLVWIPEYTKFSNYTEEPD